MSTLFAEFNAISDEPYINLTTFRKSGEAVPTPVWFAQDMTSGIIYVETGKNVGKVKRIRHTATVTIAPCTWSGKTKGDVLAGRAHVVRDTAEIYRAKGALHRKYGLTRQLFYSALALLTLIRRQEKDELDYIAIEPIED